jgi:TonB family protein
MRRFALAAVACASLMLVRAGFPQDSRSTSNEPNAEPVLKLCGPRTPRPCADVPPHATQSPPPTYSDKARKKKIEGNVVLWLVVGADGLPHNIRVTQSLGYGLDEEAIKTLNAWRFKPATMDGQPVAAAINVEMNFHLY